MKVHLKKVIGTYSRLACTKRNPFIKGNAVSLNDFLKVKPEHQCKKCLVIAIN